MNAEEIKAFNEKMNMPSQPGNGFNISMWLCGVAALICVAKALYQMFFYDKDRIDPINAYVGGDAYNYIINTNYAIAYLLLALLMTVLALWSHWQHERCMQLHESKKAGQAQAS